jgi:signal transduction histidine kinase
MADPVAVRSGRREGPSRWPWLALATFIGLAAVGTAGAAANHESIAEQVPFVVAFTLFGAVGALVLSRASGNRIGALLLYAAFTTAMAFASSELLTILVERGHRSGPLVVALGIVSNVGWVVGILPVLFLLPLLFPDGRPPTPRWRLLGWAIVASLALLALAVTLGSDVLVGSKDSAEIANPLYLGALGRFQISDAVIDVALLVLLLGSFASIVVRFRRSQGVERQQIKWVALSVLLLVLSLVVSTILSALGMNSSLTDSLITGAAFLSLPVAIGVAVLRFHLYDLDVVIRKAVVYGFLAIFATLVYLGVVVGAGAWFGRDNSLLTMVAAVVVALTFLPVRQRLTRVANRLVYGRRATPYEVLATFSERVGDAYSDEDVLPRMAGVLGVGVSAERADVWLKVEQELRDVAAWPSEAVTRPPIPLTNGRLPEIDDADRVYAVEQAGELLGALTVRKPVSDPVSPADDKLARDLAAQAGLVLRNVRLTEELRARLDDLTAAQKRIVAAQDEERRKLERNIHDGAQQQLVALAVKLHLARSIAAKDLPKADSILAELETETTAALEDLRDLARGIYPPLLADQGIEAALQAQARKAAIPVEVVAAPGVARYPQGVEAAAYFCSLEALQNVAKYANASRVQVRLDHDGSALTFDVADDGVGFDPQTATFGTGLQGMADRLAALGGTLEIRSTPGHGTVVAGRIPATAATAVADVGAPSAAPPSDREAIRGVRLSGGPP